MPVTMQDVAREAGVSAKTVFNVLGDYPYVRAATRARVMAAVQNLGYQMNFAARNLRSGRTGMIMLALGRPRPGDHQHPGPDVPLSWPSGKPVHNWQAKAVHLAERPGVQYDPIEGADLVRHGRYYYLFTSRDLCCRGADSTYKIAVGRSTSVKGPYRDEQGRDLVDGGGAILLQTRGDHVGAGGQSVYKNILAYHYYDADNTAAPYIPTLGLEKIHWKRGWPTLAR